MNYNINYIHIKNKNIKRFKLYIIVTKQRYIIVTKQRYIIDYKIV